MIESFWLILVGSVKGKSYQNLENSRTFLVGVGATSTGLPIKSFARPTRTLVLAPHLKPISNLVHNL